MKPIVKVLLGVFVAFVALLIVAAIAFKIMVDPDNLKARVTTLVKEQTGRDLTINGDLELTFFPWLGFDIGDAALGNAPGFTDDNMLTFTRANASVRLWPLVGKRIEVGTLNLSGLTISLEKNADGTTNWDDLLAVADTPAADDEAAATETTEGGAGFSPTELGGVRIKGAKVRWRDHEGGSDYQITDLDFSTGAIAAGNMVPVELSFNATSESPQVSFSTRLDTSFKPEAANSYVFEAIDLALTGQGETLPGESVSFSIQGEGGSWRGEDAQVMKPVISLGASKDPSLGDVNLSISADQLVHKVQSGVLRFDGPKAKLSATGLGADLDFKAVNVASRLSTQSLQVVKLDATGSADFGVGPSPIKLTADELLAVLTRQTLTLKNAQADILGMKIKTSLQGTQIIDGPRLSGPLEIEEFSPRDLLQKLGQAVPETADDNVLKSAYLKTTLGMGANHAAARDITLNLDDTTITGSVVMRDIAKSITDITLNMDAMNVDRYLPPVSEEEVITTSAPTPIPTEPLKNKIVNGKLTIGEFIVSNIKATDVDLTVSVRNDQFRLNPARATMYGGSYDGDLTLNVAGAKPVLSMTQSLNNINLAPFSRDMIQQERVSGTARGSVTMRGVGTDSEEIKNTMNGKFDFQVNDGAVQGFNLWYEVQRAYALATQQAAPEKTSNQTDFRALRGNATMDQGVMSTNDMIADLGFMNVQVAGDINLPEDALDLKLTAAITQVPKTPSGEDDPAFKDLSCGEIPVAVRGTTASPSIRPDIGGFLKGQAKCRIEERKEELKDKVEDELKDRLRDLIGGG
ncbi:MAG: AsmA family protein [Pseudomonadota bacterium]